MDVGGSFSELASIRIAVVPIGSISDSRFLELVAQIECCDKLPASALPKPQSSPRKPLSGGSSSTSGQLFGQAQEGARAANADVAHSATSSSSSSVFSANFFGSKSRTTNRDGDKLRRTSSKSPPRSASGLGVPGTSDEITKTENQSPATQPSQHIDTGDSQNARSDEKQQRDSSTKPSKRDEISPSTTASAISGDDPGSAINQSGVKQSNAGAGLLNTSSGSSSLISRVAPSFNDKTGPTKRPMSTPATSLKPKIWPETTQAELDAMIRLRYKVFHRDGYGNLGEILLSEWDGFHATRIVGVLGVVDCSDIAARGSPRTRDKTIATARQQFAETLSHFKNVAVSRLIVFTTSEVVLERGAFVSVSAQSPSDFGDAKLTTSQSVTPVMALPPPSGNAVSGFSTISLPRGSAVSSLFGVGGSMHSTDRANLPGRNAHISRSSTNSKHHSVSIGFVPVADRAEETRLEIRTQIVHFAGTILSCLDSWIHAQNASVDVIKSPLDERVLNDKQSKLVKRRQGRLDKINGDYLLLTGSANDALIKYNTAVERTKANSDSLWLAAAMEGACAAQVLTYMASGECAISDDVVGRILDQYSEIYKLYRKKSVFELETTAAMRLANFLGRYTHRRKDALDAADHACTVGTRLPLSAKKMLWEELTRFAEAMKFHRKAALYLYRLGLCEQREDQLCKARALMASSASHFDQREAGTWPALHRAVIVQAAHISREAGYFDDAARHYVQALSLSPQIPLQKWDTDSLILQILLRSPKPLCLPLCIKLIELVDISAPPLANLAVRPVQDQNLASPKTPTMSSKAGPFIYNPFEAQKAAARLAEASRTVTCVCGETVQVSVSLRNRLKTALRIEIIAVSMGREEDREKVWPSHWNENMLSKERSLHSGQETGGRVGVFAQSHRSLNDVQDDLVSFLTNMDSIATTQGREVELCEQSASRICTADVLIIPHIPGLMQIYGVVVRLFSGVYVTIPAGAGADMSRRPRLEVLPRLPFLELRVQADAEESHVSRITDTQITLFEGERCSVRVTVRNIGPDSAQRSEINLQAHESDLIRVLPLRDNSDVNNNMNNDVTMIDRNEEQSFVTELYAPRISSSLVAKSMGNSVASLARANDSKAAAFTTSLSLDVEYIGVNLKSHFRKTSTSVAVHVSPAIILQRFRCVPLSPQYTSVLGRHSAAGLPVTPASDGESFRVFSFEDSHGESGEALMLDVTNALITSVEVAKAYFSDGYTAKGQQIEELSILPKKDAEAACRPASKYYVDGGGTIKLVKTIPHRFLRDKLLRLTHAVSHDAPWLVVQWFVPATSRTGVVYVSLKEFVEYFNVSLHVNQSDLKSCYWVPSDLAVSSGERVSIHVALCSQETAENSAESCPMESRIKEKQPSTGRALMCEFQPIVTRRCHYLNIDIENNGHRRLSRDVSLDVSLLQSDNRGHSWFSRHGMLIGAHKSVACGDLNPDARFTHRLGIRLNSAGIFHVVATVYDPRGSHAESGSCGTSRNRATESVTESAPIQAGVVYDCSTRNESKEATSPRRAASQALPNARFQASQITDEASPSLCPDDQRSPDGEERVVLGHAHLSVQGVHDVAWSSSVLEVSPTSLAAISSGVLSTPKSELSSTQPSPDAIVQ